MKSPRLRTFGKRIVLKLGFAVVLSLVFGVNGASADHWSYTLTDPNGSGGFTSSAYPGPYGEVDVSLTSLTTATVTLTSDSQTISGTKYVYLFGGNGIIDLNVTGSFKLDSISGLNSNTNSGFTTPTSYPGSNSSNGFTYNTNQNVSTFGTFALSIDNHDGFTYSVDTLTVKLSLTSGTWSSASSVLTNNSHNASVAAHVFVAQQSTDTNGNIILTNTKVTGYAVDDGSGGTNPNVGVVPAPPSVVLFGFGGLGLACLLLRSRRRLVAAA